MTRKAFKIGAIVVAVLLAALTGTAVMANTKKELPKYVGNQACLGCHTEQYQSWETTEHATGFREVVGPKDFPGDLAAMPADLRAELEKADYIWRDMRFLARDPQTGELKYLNVQFNQTSKAYEKYAGGGVWSQNCGGCHSGAVNSGIHQHYSQGGIGCESCHGAGRDHILGKGDPTKIVNSTVPAEVCAQCHSGYNAAPNAATRFAKGYTPGTEIEQFQGFVVQEFDPAVGPPHKTSDYHRQQYPQWKASGHANATNLLIARGAYYLGRTECIWCHSTSAGIQLQDKNFKWDATKHLVNDGVSCASCHATHGSDNVADLRKEPTALCMSCHSIQRGDPKANGTIGTTRAPHSPQGDMLNGTGALGVANTKGVHTGVACIECHMTEGNHMMDVIKPSMSIANPARKDSCTKCHATSTVESRDMYFTMWEESIKSRIDTLAFDVKRFEDALKANPNALTADQKKEFEAARANFWYVQKDKSNGAHNFEYALKILTKVQSDFAKLKKVLQ